MSSPTDGRFKLIQIKQRHPVLFDFELVSFTGCPKLFPHPMFQMIPITWGILYLGHAVEVMKISSVCIVGMTNNISNTFRQGSTIYQYLDVYTDTLAMALAAS